MAAEKTLLLELLRMPAHATRLRDADWDLLIRQARKAGLGAKLQQALAAEACLDQMPERPRLHLDTAVRVADRLGEALRWELTQILDAVSETNSPIVLLKGAAYVAAGLPVAKGRTFGDVDILVPRGKIEAVESALMQHGWAPMKLNAYDQRYYRQWMHEIPPLEHVRRQSVIDVHHTILPLTARYHPDAALLLADSRPSSLDPRARVLAPPDMALHCATHLFHEGETDRALRDLIDFDGLLRHFGTAPDFWEALVPRAQALQLTRPLFYGLRYATRLLGTPVPERVSRSANIGKPPMPVRMAMDWLTAHGFRPDHASCADPLTPLAHFLIYVRGHWLRMPPRLLIPHLLHKAFPRSEK